MRGKFLIGTVVASLLLLAAIAFLLPPAPGEPDGEPGTGAAGETRPGPFALDDVGELNAPGAAMVGGEELTSEQIAAFEKMHAELPGNIFLPLLPGEKDRLRVEERDTELLRMRRLHFLIEKGQGSADERRRYYDFRIQYNRDKIAMLLYVARKERDADGNERLPENIQQMIDELNGEIGRFEEAR